MLNFNFIDRPLSLDTDKGCLSKPAWKSKEVTVGDGFTRPHRYVVSSTPMAAQKTSTYSGRLPVGSNALAYEDTEEKEGAV